MHTNKKLLIGFSYLLLLGVASCSLPTDYDAAMERDVDATIQYKEDAKAPQTPADTDVIRIKDDIWLGDTSEVEYEGDKPLPSYLETPDGVTLVSNRPITLYEIGNMISQITSIKMRFAPQLESTAKAAADRNAPTVAKVGSKWSDTSRMLLSYKGSLSGLLDEVCSYFGVWWKYENGEIYIYKYTTKTFTLYALGTEVAYQTAVSTDDSNEVSLESTLKEWDEVESAISSIIGKSDNEDFTVSRSLGTITVTASPSVLARVGEYIERQNKRLSQLITIDVKVLQVTISNDSAFGLNLAAAINSTSGLNIVANPKNNLASTEASSMNIAVLSNTVSALTGATHMENGSLVEGAYTPDQIMNGSLAGAAGSNALIEALKGGRLAGAYLDVIKDEPSAGDVPGSVISRAVGGDRAAGSELPENLVLMPHSSAFSPDYLKRCFMELADDRVI